MQVRGVIRVPSIPFLSSLHGTGIVNSVALFLDTTYPSPSTSPLSTEDDDGKLDSYVERECDLKGHIPYQRDVEPNEYNCGHMAIFSCGATNAHGWYHRCCQQFLREHGEYHHRTRKCVQ
jgi:hypothetical protein